MPQEITTEEVTAAMKKYLLYTREYWGFVKQFFPYDFTHGEEFSQAKHLTQSEIYELEERQEKLKMLEDNYERKLRMYLHQVSRGQ